MVQMFHLLRANFIYFFLSRLNANRFFPFDTNHDNEKGENYQTDYIQHEHQPNDQMLACVEGIRRWNTYLLQNDKKFDDGDGNTKNAQHNTDCFEATTEGTATGLQQPRAVEVAEQKEGKKHHDEGQNEADRIAYGNRRW